MGSHISVIGGGLGGLTAAIACAEAGVPVRLYEAHDRLGGRGRATPPPYVAHDGAHVFYADGPHYKWLKKRGFVNRLGWPGPVAMATLLHFRVDGRIGALPPLPMLRPQSRKWLTAPVDVDFHTWASGRWGEKTATQMANAISVVTYHADTGQLSAAFVWTLFQRVLGPNPPAVRWVRGGWAARRRHPLLSRPGARPVGSRRRVSRRAQRADELRQVRPRPDLSASAPVQRNRVRRRRHGMAG